MELKKITICGKEVEFVNQYRNTRMGFAHDTTMFVDGRQYGTATCNYYNRTWECYTYQTVMLTVVHNLSEARQSYLKDRFKADHNYQKMTPKRTQEFEVVLNDDEEYKFYQTLYKRLSDRYV